MGYWYGYLSVVRCRLFAYGPANATASQNLNINLPTKAGFTASRAPVPKNVGPLIYPTKSVWPVQPLGATNPCTDSLTHSSRTVYYVIATFLSKRNSRSQRLATFTAQNQGRLNQWAHWARAQGPGFFFFLRGPQLAVVK